MGRLEKKQVGKTSPAPGLLPVTFQFQVCFCGCVNKPFSWPRWQDANPESICIVNFLDVFSKRLTTTKLFRKSDRDEC